jgi:hypothetical protein
MSPKGSSKSPATAPRRRPVSSAPKTGPAPVIVYSNAPKIGGSEAAFIVLVIILAIVVIFASIAIYYMIRDRSRSSEERAERHKYSVKKDDERKHAFSIGSLSEKIRGMFKGRRKRAGWEPANDEADEWDSKDEPVNHLPDLPYDPAPAYPHVGSAPKSHRATLTEASESLHKSRMASHVEDTSSIEDYARHGPPPMFMPTVHAQAPSAPDVVWLNAPDSRGGLSNVGTLGHVDYYAPQPRRADSGPEIPLFAGSIPFR